MHCFSGELRTTPILLLKVGISPDWCGSVDWALACEQKGYYWLVSIQGAGLGCRPGPQLGGVWEAINQCFSPSLLPSLPLSLKINKWNLFFKKSWCQIYFKSCIFISLKLLMNDKISGRLQASVIKPSPAPVIKQRGVVSDHFTDYFTGKWSSKARQ